jgi:Gamma-glutamyl cyclotransferase, AIG2-like
MDGSATELLFSYGTLQLERVQLAIIGRPLTGTPDALLGFVATPLASDDPATIALSGSTHHPIARYTGRMSDSISGTLFSITPDELRRADEYETLPYERVAVLLRSGARAWAYVDGRYRPPAD